MRWVLRGFLPTILLIVAAAMLLPGSALAGGTKHLAGSWRGKLAHAMAGKVVRNVNIRITIDKAQTGGSWYVSRTCHGTLRNDGISWGYHHYREKLARGSTCVGGAIDCLQRDGAKVFDNVTPPSAVSYSASAVLRRVKT